jgi:hypothetical protein
MKGRLRLSPSRVSQIQTFTAHGAGAPFFLANPGWVRSRAWIWLFSSPQRTKALFGGLRESPITSSTWRRSSWRAKFCRSRPEAACARARAISAGHGCHAAQAPVGRIRRLFMPRHGGPHLLDLLGRQRLEGGLRPSKARHPIAAAHRAPALASRRRIRRLFMPRHGGPHLLDLLGHQRLEGGLRPSKARHPIAAAHRAPALASRRRNPLRRQRWPATRSAPARRAVPNQPHPHGQPRRSKSARSSASAQTRTFAPITESSVGNGTLPVC